MFCIIITRISVLIMGKGRVELISIGRHCTNSSMCIIPFLPHIPPKGLVFYFFINIFWKYVFYSFKHIYIGTGRKKVSTDEISFLSEFLKNFFSFFNWSLVDIQCCVSFRCTAKWFSYNIYMYIFQILFPYRLLQNIDYSSLCSRVGPCWLSILYIVVCMC